LRIIQRKPIALLFAVAIQLVGNNGVFAAEWRFSGVDRVVAVADIQGAYGALETILQQSGVIDESLRWSGGATHLVIVGDVLDRGPNSRLAMDLIMRLEMEAPVAGGRVHLILGNHELMNLTGDLRYVSAGEYAAFADEEPLDSREAAFVRFLERLEEPLDQTSARAGFDQRFPFGFFAHRAAFASDGAYGRWLLEHPLLVLINDTAFVHGGLPEAVIELGGDGVNTDLAQELREYVAAKERLTTARVLSVADEFYDHLSVLDAFDERVALGEAAWPDGLRAVADQLRLLNRALTFTLDSPTWYRGTVSCSALIERDRLVDALEAIGAERVVVGHTPTPNARILSRMDGAVLRIDTGMLNEFYGGRAAALILEGSEVSVIYENESDVAEPLPQPRRVGLRPAGLTADELEDYLSNAEVVRRTEVDELRTVVTLRREDVELEAVFMRTGRSRFRPEVAAYRLDRLLGLDMVPVTVARDLDGEAGSLQYSPHRVVNESERVSQGVGGSRWCPLTDQFQAMYIFDSLILNEGRVADRIRYSVDNFQLILVGHEYALSTKRGRPGYLEEVTLEIGGAWREALSSLNEELLTEALGDVLDRRRIRVLLQRRDALLEDAMSR